MNKSKCHTCLYAGFTPQRLFEQRWIGCHEPHGPDPDECDGSTLGWVDSGHLLNPLGKQENNVPMTRRTTRCERHNPIDENDYPLTKEYLKRRGFKKDNSAPDNVDRWYLKQKGYLSWYITVTFNQDKAAGLLITKTEHDMTGAVINTGKFSRSTGNISLATLYEGLYDLGLKSL